MISIFKKSEDKKKDKLFSKNIKRDFDKKIKRPINQYFIYK